MGLKDGRCKGENHIDPVFVSHMDEFTKAIE
jgi:hypothetical protein